MAVRFAVILTHNSWCRSLPVLLIIWTNWQNFMKLGTSIVSLENTGSWISDLLGCGKCNAVVACRCFGETHCLHFKSRPWRWLQHILLKHLYTPTMLNDVAVQKITKSTQRHLYTFVYDLFNDVASSLPKFWVHDNVISPERRTES